MDTVPELEERYRAFFEQATENATPLPYQTRLATEIDFRALLDVPTGLETAAAILAWVWRRRFAEDPIRRSTPRRLVYCLPMRVLVEQTFTEAVRWLDRLGLLAGETHWTQVGADHLPTKKARLCRGNDGKERGYAPLRRSQRFAKRVGRRSTASEGGTLLQFISCSAARRPTGLYGRNETRS